MRVPPTAPDAGRADGFLAKTHKQGSEKAGLANARCNTKDGLRQRFGRPTMRPLGWVPRKTWMPREDSNLN